jgi:two-component system sensor histidine kinase HydH
VDIRTQAALLAAIVTLALAVAALLRDSRPRVFTVFAFLAIDLSLFSLALCFLRWPEFGAAETWWNRLAVASGSLIPSAGPGARPGAPATPCWPARSAAWWWPPRR